MSDNQLFTDEDQVALAKTRSLRLRMIDQIAKKSDAELPSKPSELLAIAQLTVVQDKSVIDQAKLRMDSAKNENDATANRLLLMALMREIHENKPQFLSEEGGGQIPEYQSTDALTINDTELVRGMQTPDVEAVLKGM